MSEDLPDPELEALAVLIDRTLAAEARADAPPESERGDWLYGGVDSVAFTEPDAHGWMSIVPVADRAWIPKALVSWQVAVRTGFPPSPAFLAHPALSLARWPAIERAVQMYIAASTGK